MGRLPRSGEPPGIPADAPPEAAVRSDRPHPLFYGFVEAAVEQTETTT